MKVIVLGTGGQGVKFLGTALGNILVRLGYEVALAFDFDAAVRGGDSAAFLVFSKSPIGNPVVSAADVLVKLSEGSKDYPAAKVISGIDGKPLNMHALGVLLKEIGIHVGLDDIRAVLPERGIEENLKVLGGYLGEA